MRCNQSYRRHLFLQKNDVKKNACDIIFSEIGGVSKEDDTAGKTAQTLRLLQEVRGDKFLHICL